MRTTMVQPSDVNNVNEGTKADKVYERLRALIISGHLPPGASLDQTKLASQLNVSRMPLRQALLRLNYDGLVVLKSGSTAKVAELSRRAVKELYAIRTALEPMVAEVAARRISEDSIVKLRELNAEMEVAVNLEQFEQFVSLDRMFHRTLYTLSGYDRAFTFIEKARDASDRYIFAYAIYQKGAEESLTEHDGIISACVRNNSELVKQCVERHVIRGSQILLELID